jgi:hypothetical protein
MLPPWILPVVLKLVPVAAPMLGVVKLALTLTEIFPPASNAVVSLSTLALNCVPTRLKPAEVLALYVAAWLNCAKVMFEVPNVFYFSGYSSSIISFLSSKIQTASELVDAALSQELMTYVLI